MTDGQTSSTVDEPSEEPAAEVPAALERAIAQNPEEVARFLQQLGLVNDLLDTAQLATAGMDDEMVQQLTATGTNLAAAADGAATPELARLGESVGENADDLATALETVVELQRTGTLDQLAEAADAIALLSAALDDDMVMHLASTGSRLGEVVDTAAQPETVHGLERLLQAVGDADGADPEPVGAVGLVRALRDPEVRTGLGFALALAKALGSDLDGETED